MSNELLRTPSMMPVAAILDRAAMSASSSGVGRVDVAAAVLVGAAVATHRPIASMSALDTSPEWETSKRLKRTAAVIVIRSAGTGNATAAKLTPDLLLVRAAGQHKARDQEPLPFGALAGLIVHYIDEALDDAAAPAGDKPVGLTIRVSAPMTLRATAGANRRTLAASASAVSKPDSTLDAPVSSQKRAASARTT